MLKKSTFQELIITDFDSEAIRERKLNIVLEELKNSKVWLRDSTEQLKNTINETDDKTKELIIELLDEINACSFIYPKIKVKNNKKN